jgi:hypothetical protein
MFAILWNAEFNLLRKKGTMVLILSEEFIVFFGLSN